jgi:RND family efflux transporter MFP subunit
MTAMNRTLVLLLLPALAACSTGREEPEAKPLVAVTVAPAELADVEVTVHAPATLHARQEAGVASRITAPIRELRARKGDRVTAGETLVRLDDRDLVAQREEVAAALHQAEVVAGRRAELFKEGAIPQRELLAAQTDLAQSTARLEQVRAQLAFGDLKSPFSGVITEQFLYPGDMAQPSSPVFTVADIGAVVARAQVPASTAGPVRSGETCSFTATDQENDSRPGRVTVVNRAVDAARQTVEVWCEIANDKAQLLPGAFGQITILTGRMPGSVVVPLEAVEFAEGTHEGAVYVVDSHKVAHRREIEGGIVFDARVQVLRGLKAGEVVVVQGSYGLPDGAEVTFTDRATEEGR